VRTPDEHSIALRQADQARSPRWRVTFSVYAADRGYLRTRFARLTLLAMLTRAALVLAAIEVLFPR